MKMSDPSQATFWQETELPLMSSRAAFLAKTLAWQESKPELEKEREAVSGPKSSDLLASYHPATSSWRTSQTCLVALAKNEADGLAEFSETWPSAGMMQNGKTYRRQPWALPIAENAFGLWHGPQSDGTWPTPTKTMRDGRQTPGSALSLMKAVKGWRRDGTLWPTPTTCMIKGSSPASLTRKDGRDRSSDRLDHAVMAIDGGKLNPRWVEWLMGFPIGHTDLQD